MKNIKKIPSWALKQRESGTQITRIKNRYYLYKVKSVWDPAKQRSKKITEEYLGRITEDGLIPPKHKRDLKLESTKEYGNILFVKKRASKLINALKKEFPYNFQSIISLAILKLCYRCRIKNMSLRYQTSYTSKFFKEAKMSPNSISDLLKSLGNNIQKINRFFDLLKEKGETLAIDLTTIFTDSENIHYAEKGHNSKKIYHNQLQFLLLHSLNQNLPTYFKVLPGSVRDVSSLINTIEESEYKDLLLVGDRGFTSEDNWNYLEEKLLDYVFPLRKNSRLLDYEPEKHNNYFEFRKRHIWYREIRREEKRIIQFLDKKLMVEEETTFLHLVKSEVKSIEEYHKSKKSFGIISIITNTEKEPIEIYEIYKKRNDIEVAFDIMKNSLEDDKTYMQSTESVKGYFFITFLALYLYINLQNVLREKDLLKKHSVLDVLLQLSKIYKVNVGNKELVSEIPKQTRLIIEKLGVPIT